LSGRTCARAQIVVAVLKAPFMSDLRKGPMQQDPLPAAAPIVTRYVALAAPIVWIRLAPRSVWWASCHMGYSGW